MTNCRAACLRAIRALLLSVVLAAAWGNAFVAAAEIPVDPDFRGETIYRVLLTRFNDGDATNNFYGRERIDRGDPHWRGDFAGLIAALDYVRDLGFSAILISPPIENRGALDYHGTFGYDWLKVDPRLESLGGTYLDFIRAAHERGMKVIQSVVVNHTSNYGIRHQFWINRLPHKYYRAKAMVVPWPYEIVLGNYKSAFRDDNDNPKAPDWFWERVRRDPFGGEPLLDPKTGTTVPKMDYRADRFFGTDEADLDRNWYHRNGWMTDADWSDPDAIQGKHQDADSIDLATENMTVRAYFREAVRTYAHWGVDGICVEHARHVDRTDLHRMVDDWRGDSPHLFFCAEVANLGSGWGDAGSPQSLARVRPWYYTRVAADPAEPDSGPDSRMAVFDYPLFVGLRDTLAVATFTGLAPILSADWIYGNPTTLITFFQNARVGPTYDVFHRFNGPDANAALAYNLMWTVRGIPCLFQGEEIAFMKGAPVTIGTGAEVLAVTGRAYFGGNLTPASLPTTQSHPLYRHIQRLNQIRRAVPALQRGQLVNGRVWSNGMSFVRQMRTPENISDSYVVVGLGVGADQTMTVTNVRSGNYVDAVTGATQTVATASLRLTFTVRANSIGAWVLDGPGKIGNDGPWLQ